MNFGQNGQRTCSVCGTSLAVYGCQRCGGSGTEAGWFSNSPCPDCHGTGNFARCPNQGQHYVRVNESPFSLFGKRPFNFQQGVGVPPFHKTCPECDGTGKKPIQGWQDQLFQEVISGRICPKCFGKGYVPGL